MALLRRALAAVGIAGAIVLAVAGVYGVSEYRFRRSYDLPAVALAQRHHMHAVFETARMYTGRPPAVNMHGLYGVTTFELG